MNKIEIDLDEYLDEGDRKEIAREEFRYALRRNLNTANDLERFIGNSIYVSIWQELDTLSDDVNAEIVGSLRKKLRARLDAVVPELAPYMVFYRAEGPLRRKNSVGADLLDEAVSDAKPLIESKVREIIGGLEEYDIKDALKERFAEMLDGALS